MTEVGVPGLRHVYLYKQVGRYTLRLGCVPHAACASPSTRTRPTRACHLHEAPSGTHWLAANPFSAAVRTQLGVTVFRGQGSSVVPVEYPASPSGPSKPCVRFSAIGRTAALAIQPLAELVPSDTDVAGVGPSPGADVAGDGPSPGADVAGVGRLAAPAGVLRARDGAVRGRDGFSRRSDREPWRVAREERGPPATAAISHAGGTQAHANASTNASACRQLGRARGGAQAHARVSSRVMKSLSLHK